jgi:hypothetical protein
VIFLPPFAQIAQGSRQRLCGYNKTPDYQKVALQAILPIPKYVSMLFLPGFLYHLNILGKLLFYVVSIRRRDGTAAYSTSDY